MAVACTGWASVRLETLSAPLGERELLYLPNGRHLRLASLGHAGLAADLVYLWSIQFYSDYDRSDRFRYVEHVFGTVIPDLDPHYLDAYAMGALILVVEAGDLEGALRVLERGIRDNPEEWILPYLAGWECYRAQRLDEAARYFERAAAIPGAPGRLQRNRAGVVARSGDLRDARRLWKEIHDDPSADDKTRRIARRRMDDLEIRIELGDLERAVSRYTASRGRPPRDLDDLVRAGVVSELPVDPQGHAYVFDPESGRVKTAQGRTLKADR